MQYELYSGMKLILVSCEEPLRFWVESITASVPLYLINIYVTYKSLITGLLSFMSAHLLVMH